MTGMFQGNYDDGPVAAPQPLDIKAALADPVDFPLDALPPMLADAIRAIVDIAQVPVSLAAQSVLASVSLVAQAFINVETITGQSVPTSTYYLTIAASGDRKSTSDREASRPVKEREEELATSYEAKRLAFAIDDAAYKAAITAAKSNGKGDREKIRNAIEAAGRPPLPPLPPLQPLLTCDEPTGPGLQRTFAEGMPALGLFSDEGATFLGGWAMQEENQAATGGMLSKLWDGSPIKRIRSDKENGTQILYNRRLSVHLMIQPDLAGKLLGNHAVRSQGLLSRILPVAPRSLKGTRFFKEAGDEARTKLAAYHQRLAKLLAADFAFRDGDRMRGLDCDLVRLTSEAKTILVQFSDHCEKLIAPGGQYEEIGDFASKMAENAVRLAASIAFFSGGPRVVGAGLSDRAMRAGIALMEHYAGEALRLYGTPSVDQDTANAVILIDFIRKKGWEVVGQRHLNRTAPVQVRSAAALKRAIEVLIENHHLVPINAGAHLPYTEKREFNVKAYTVIPLEAG